MAERKELATRFGMGALAALFLITSIGFSLLVIWQSKQNQKEEAAIKAAQQATSNTSESTNQSNEETENMLQGTKLANFSPLDKIEELQSIDTKAGDGAEVKEGDTVTAHYTGAVAKDGTIFQSSHDGEGKPIPFSLNQVIEGWTKGVPGMKVGGVRRLLIPASMAYGANPPQGSGIPANADLVFDIELVAVGQ